MARKPAGGRLRTNDPAGVRKRILDATADAFQKRGYHATSTHDIVRAAGVTAGALHHHFPTKAGLGTALISRYHDRFGEALAEILANSEDAGVRLQAYVRLYSKVLRNKRMCLCGVLAADFETLPRPMRDGVLSFFGLNEEWLTRVLEEGRQAETLRFEGPAARIAAFLVSSLEGAMLLARSYGKISRFESVAKKLLDDLVRDAER